MHKYLIGFVILCILPISAMAEKSFPAQTDKQYVIYHKKHTPVNVFINEYRQGKEKEVPVSNWYMGLRGAVSFLSWTTKWDNSFYTASGEEKFNFKPIVGGDLTLGYRLNKNWRFDGEFGYGGKFSETETEYLSVTERTEFSLETYYASVNAYYDIDYGFYAGLGAGVAIVDNTFDSSIVRSVSSTKASLLGAVMLGWSYAFNEKIDFDVRYRLSFFQGNKLTTDAWDDVNNKSVQDAYKLDTGLIMNNSISAGIRYHF